MICNSVNQLVAIKWWHFKIKHLTTTTSRKDSDSAGVQYIFICTHGIQEDNKKSSRKYGWIQCHSHEVVFHDTSTTL